MTPMTVRIGCVLAATATAISLVGCGRQGAHVSSAATTGTVRGHITAGPTCPVERVASPCPPRPVVSIVEATVGTRVVASTRSATDGSYRLDVPSGSYVITARPAGMFPRCSPRPARAAAARIAVVDIACDTGIR
jgi:hypothetical protein